LYLVPQFVENKPLERLLNPARGDDRFDRVLDRRDHRADLKQRMLVLATTHEGDVPLFMRPLDGNGSDARTLVAAVEALKEQVLRLLGPLTKNSTMPLSETAECGL
jgi:hypothetical protein